MNFDKKYVVWALSYAAVGLVLGIYMAATHNHAELVTHAHILLIGFVVSLIVRSPRTRNFSPSSGSIPVSLNVM